MIFSIVVHASPASSQAAATALRFAAAVLRGGHGIERLFFLADGVGNACSLTVTARDETDLQERWRELIREHGIKAGVCVSSAIRRGVVDAQQAQRHELAGASLHPEFAIAGLGELLEACARSDRVVSFG